MPLLWSGVGRLRVLDLFSGTGDFSAAFVARGHHVRRVDNSPQFSGVPFTAIADALAESESEPWDVVLAGIICTYCSTMTIRYNWKKENGRRIPVSDGARMTLSMLDKVLRVFRGSGARYLVIENPRAMMRKTQQVADLDRRTVTYCQYGRRQMKATDFFGKFPAGWETKQPCKARSPCHIAAPRKSRTGTQGMNPVEAARVPYGISLSLCLAIEAELAGGADMIQTVPVNGTVRVTLEDFGGHVE